MTEKNSRMAALRQKMADQDIDLVCLGPGAHLKWLLGLHPHADERPLLLCVSGTGAGFLIPASEAESLREKTELPFFQWGDAEGPDGALERLLMDLRVTEPRRIVLDEAMRADFAALVQDCFENAQGQFTASTLGELRMRKDDSACRALKKNADIADRALQSAWAMMKPGLREADIRTVIEESFLSQGAKPLFGIVAAGRNGAFPHHQTSDTELKHGDAIVMDIGGGVDDYSSDITRMAIIGEAPKGYHEIHQTVNNAVEAALETARPGVPAWCVDKAARDVITRAGYGAFFVHRTGHGLGVEIHEPPYITATSETILDEGMVFSIEPGIYLPDRFGIRLEDIVVLRADGPEILSGLSRDAAIIDA
ncbi:MAG: M24 family metallopeptidase [Rhodobacteraceae bacterium]|nr:M24 family metallopeptidase [Paracoccaceae bacterium]